LSAITTHVLDTARGRPAAGVAVRLMRVADGGGEIGTATTVATSATGEDGRAGDLGPATVEPGTYRLIFDTGAYYRSQPDREPFFPEVTVSFTVLDPAAHYHVPLLLSPYGYTTYRGS
jgi:5-hydroxyisourate hydrolase